MAQLSAKELSGLQDLLSGEELLIKKFKMLSETTSDPELKQQFLSISQRHQSHYDAMYSQLQ